MDHLHRGVSALEDVERQLKALASEALDDNAWEAVTQLAAWAKAIRGILDTSSGAEPAGRQDDRSESPPRVTRKATSTSRGTAAVKAEKVGATTKAKSTASSRQKQARTRTQPRATRTRPKSTRTYPVFVRDGETLIKVGWSKKTKKEYEHRVPKRILDLVSAAAGKEGAKGTRFTIEQLLPLVDDADGTETPSYQTYACVAWLREQELFIQHGRQGYSIPTNGDFFSQVRRAWETTLTRDHSQESKRG